MSAGVRVFGGMAIWRSIATESRAALLTGAQMHPGRTDLHAFLTLSTRRERDRRDLGDVEADSARHRL